MSSTQFAVLIGVLLGLCSEVSDDETRAVCYSIAAIGVMIFGVVAWLA